MHIKQIKEALRRSLRLFHKYFKTARCGRNRRLQRQDEASEREIETVGSGDRVSAAQTKEGIPEDLVRRFRTWIDHVLSEEPVLRGIPQELLEELKEKSDHQDLVGLENRHDLYSMWSAITAVTQEVKLQGRTFKRLADKIDTFSGLDRSIDSALRAHAEALGEAKKIAEQARKVSEDHEEALVRHAEVRGRRQILNVLLDVRERLTRGLEPARESLAKMEEGGSSGWLSRTFRRQDAGAVHTRDVLNALINGYALSLDRIDEAMQEFGVREIICKGLPFDPRAMRAVDVQETGDVPEGVVLEVYRTGYMLDDEVLWPAQVKVARAVGTGTK
ncbi:MAG: nucleotide exchange factor GrpE [Desulfobacteria bacterium]